MDGVDIAYCEFIYSNGAWAYEIKNASTVPYNQNWMVRLSQLYKQPIHLYPKTDSFYGKYLGKITHHFIQENKLKIDFIASHGHTIFHQPINGFTAQIGCGAAISAECNLPVVNNFRPMDVMLGGQGAPLVPIGDNLLFNQYNACLNLGGFANISFLKSQKAFDISPCNMALNYLANKLNHPYDNDGKIGNSGHVNLEMLSKLNQLAFYKKTDTKSLGIEWFNKDFLPILLHFENEQVANKLATVVKHIAQQIVKVIQEQNIDNVLATGGGAFNSFLMGEIKKLTPSIITVPNNLLVSYKEALIFAFLGVLRIRNEVNILKTVTGASKNCIGGALHGNFNGLI
jgi:anhydro-N-acetylmuramic acid kinase